MRIEKKSVAAICSKEINSISFFDGFKREREREREKKSMRIVFTRAQRGLA